ncbi:hypothetical protein ABZW10_36575 [Kitasatospora sp. NPDC004723]|uniref:hypothetical protein n=1 Tax=Kitasatospora sp. NPDC004723 TaxID=3154288 RepID=UPI0033AF8C33
MDADELRDVAVFARSMGQDPVAAVDQVVREALAELAAWETDLVRLGRELLTVDPDRPGLPMDVVDAGRELDARLTRARATVLASVCEYHHGGAGPETGERPW